MKEIKRKRDFTKRISSLLARKGIPDGYSKGHVIVSSKAKTSGPRKVKTGDTRWLLCIAQRLHGAAVDAHIPHEARGVIATRGKTSSIPHPYYTIDIRLVTVELLSVIST